MLILLLHFVSGALAGATCRVGALATFVIFVLIGVAACSLGQGLLFGLAWLFASQVALQVGYLLGALLRSGLEDTGLIGAHGDREAH